MARQIVALCTVLALLAVPSHEQGSQGSTLTSPCPNVFLYDSPGSVLGLWSGVVTLTTDILLHSTWLNIVLDSHATKLGNWLGNVTTLDGIDFIIENDEMQIHPGQPVSVPFFIQYDPLNTIPRLRGIRLNGRVICDDVTQQRGTVSGPVVPGPEIKTNLDMKPVRTPPSKPNNPVNRRPVNNNSSAAPAFNPEQQTYSNTSATSVMVECGVVSGGNEGVTLSFKGLNYLKGDIPWLAAIYNDTGATLTYICGGTLVSDRHVVTAANCIVNRHGVQTAIKNMIVKLGAHDLNDWSDDNTITRTLVAVSIHEDYNPSTFQNNIMIISLDKRVKFDQYIRPACLWTGDTALSSVVGATGVVSGWGVTTAGDIDRDSKPHMVLVPIVSTSYCRASKPAFHVLTSDKTFCAGARNGVGPCTGDGGAGLYLLEGGRWRLRGIVSVSLRDESNEKLKCDLNEYTVYTDTAQYMTWMRYILSVKYE